MNSTGIPADKAVHTVLHILQGMPVFLTGSAAAAVVHDKPHAYTDVDLFVPNPGMYFATVQRLLDVGHRLESERFEKMWRRHQVIGFNAWHTNSMKLIDQMSGTEVNVIYKKVDGHETTRLSQVLESFDFGLLAVGYETMTSKLYDMRSYFFGPGANDGRPLPMLPYRQETVGQGFMSQFVMMRTPGRYARYASTYGYDLHLIKPTLVQGFIQYHEYKSSRSKPEDLTLGQIALALGSHIENDEFDKLLEFEANLPTTDGLDDIMASLE